ncbi:hypothetical protein WICMUC_003820 [Wickerhamomyces mucosus]|uniref:RRM domain-containing protein n=1 Tax=Wickerhamomyces mucosus TaxID=1378264 RepID=A0A9P8PJG4_9ASCO|nr:hypothetical protein WICMUC_003820 [Wickerhamomyces mucosus]
MVSLNLKDRIGSKSTNPSKSAKKNPRLNPLLQRIGNNKVIKKSSKQSKIGKSNVPRDNKGEINPLFAALQNGKQNKSKRVPTATKKELKHQNKASSSTQKIISIKSTTNKFLKITNLAVGTTSNDLYNFLSKIGPITNIRIKDLPSGSTLAEVYFQNQENLTKARKQLHGTTADGRVLGAIISKTSEIEDNQDNQFIPQQIQQQLYQPYSPSDLAALLNGRGLPNRR